MQFFAYIIIICMCIIYNVLNQASYAIHYLFLFVEPQCVSPTLIHSNMNSPTAIVLQGLSIIFHCDVNPSNNPTVTDIKWFINGSENYENGPTLIFKNVQSDLSNTNIKCSAVYYDLYYYNSSEVILLVQGKLTIS